MMNGSSINCQGVPTWDIMLSYRRKKYASIVSSLADFAEEAGLRCWLDIRNIDQTITFSKEEHQSILRDAAEKSRIVVGFLDEDTGAFDLRTGKFETMFNWRFYEKQFAHEFVWVEGSFLCSFPDTRIPFYNLPHLAYYLALACSKRDSLPEFWNHRLAGLSSVVRYGIYLVAKFHEMPTDFLPPIIHPGQPEARSNSIHTMALRKRQDVEPNHNMKVFE